jgi:hypothetical protein
MGIFSAGRGIGAVLSGPISENLLGCGGFATDGLKIGYGTSYGVLTVFTGVSAACEIVCLGVWERML